MPENVYPGLIGKSDWQGHSGAWVRRLCHRSTGRPRWLAQSPGQGWLPWQCSISQI